MYEVADSLFEDLGQRFIVFGVEYLYQDPKALTENAGERMPIDILKTSQLLCVGKIIFREVAGLTTPLV